MAFDDPTIFIMNILGAQVGINNVFSEGMNDSALLAEYLQTGEDVIFGAECKIATVGYGVDYLYLGKVQLDSGVKVGFRAYLSPGVHVREGCLIDHMASVTPKSVLIDEEKGFLDESNVAKGLKISGIPAKPTDLHVQYQSRESRTARFPNENSSIFDRRLKFWQQCIWESGCWIVGMWIMEIVVANIVFWTWPFVNDPQFNHFLGKIHIGHYLS